MWSGIIINSDEIWHKSLDRKKDETVYMSSGGKGEISNTSFDKCGWIIKILLTFEITFFFSL